MPASTSPTRRFARPPAAGWPVLIMLSGLPASGKSYVGRLLAAAMPAVIVENDSIRRKLFDVRVYSVSENRHVYQEAMRQIRETIGSGNDVVFDATNLTEPARRNVLKLSTEIDAGLAIVQLITKEHVVVPRLERRISTPDPEDRSEAGKDVYDHLRPIFSRSRLPHWRIESSEQAIQIVDEVVETIRTVRAIGNN